MIAVMVNFINAAREAVRLDVESNHKMWAIHRKSFVF